MKEQFFEECLNIIYKLVFIPTDYVFKRNNGLKT